MDKFVGPIITKAEKKCSSKMKFPNLTKSEHEMLADFNLTLRKDRNKKAWTDTRSKTDKFEVAIKCNYCDYTSTHSSYISMHIQNKHTGEKQKCTKCSFSHCFSTKLRTHFMNVHLKVPRGHRLVSRFCDECSFQTKRADNLRHHKESVHEGIIYSCDICSYKTNRKSTIKQHQQQHQGKQKNIIERKERPTMTCNEDLCLFRTSFRHSMKKHKETKHEGIILFRCDIMNCLYGTNDKKGFTRHTKTHTKPYACSECDNKFTTYASSKTHLRKHKGEKPLCSLCSRFFSCRDSLSNHQKIHKEFRLLECSECNKKFFQSRDLKEHELSHYTKIIKKITLKDKVKEKEDHGKTRKNKVQNKKTLTVYCCPLDLCQFTIGKQQFKVTTEAVSHLMEAHGITQEDFVNVPEDKFKFVKFTT